MKGLCFLCALMFSGCHVFTSQLSSLESAAAKKRYGVLIDAGSSGSRIYVYYWDETPADFREVWQAPPGLGQVPWSYKVTPGLSSFADAPEEGAKSLVPLLEYSVAKLKEQVPHFQDSDLGSIPIFLKGTAGLRLLKASQVERLLEKVRAMFHEKGFMLANRPDEGVSMISGEDEGIFGWVAVNYLKETLIGQSKNSGGVEGTLGALDLGGASTQITFAISGDQKIVKGTKDLNIGGHTYSLFTHSFLDFGQDRMRERFANRSCYFPGFQLPKDIGTGDFDACRRQLKKHLMDTKILPTIPLKMGFYGFSAFYYNTAAAGVAGNHTPKELYHAGKDLCQTPWERAAGRSGVSAFDSELLWLKCFGITYVYTLLTDVYGFDEKRSNLFFVDKLLGARAGEHELSWTLGAMVYEINNL